MAPRTGRRRGPAPVPRSRSRPERRTRVGALDRISVAAIGTSIADLEAETLRAEAAGVECVWAPELFRSRRHPGGLPGGEDRADRRRHRDRLGLHPQPLHPRDHRTRHRRDVGRALPARTRLGREAAQRDLAQRRLRQARPAPARGDRGDPADHAAGGRRASRSATRATTTTSTSRAGCGHTRPRASRCRSMPPPSRPGWRGWQATSPTV